MSEAAVRDHFHGQAAACRTLGSAFTATLLDGLADRLDRATPVGIRVLDWPGSPQADALALRLAGALHALVRAGADGELAACYPPRPTDPARLIEAALGAVRRHDGLVQRFLDGPPQTNEVARSAILLCGYLTIAARTGLGLEIIELGASAGLNLAFDAYGYALGPHGWGDQSAPVRIRTDFSGEPPDLARRLDVAARCGCDLNPIDPCDAAARERMLAYVWADQTERLARAEAALRLACSLGIRVETADAAVFLAGRLAEPPIMGTVRVVAHTIVWQYLPPHTRSTIEGLLADFGSRVTAADPLAWLRVEPDGQEPGAAVLLTTWPGGRTEPLGRADYHGRWIRWGAAAR